MPPAHYLTIDTKTLKVETKEYWNFKKIKIDLKNPEDHLEDLLSKSLKLRLRSDVKYGLYYSKGMDLH